jgi:hypothetical protein
MNAPLREQTIKIPTITLPSETVERVLTLLGNGVIFVKSADGSMRPFVDPMPITQLILGAIQAQMKPDTTSD